MALPAKTGLVWGPLSYFQHWASHKKTIKQDYLLTNEILSPLVQKRLTKAKNDGMTETNLETIKALMSVSSGYFDAAMATIAKNYGSMSQFLNQALQLSNEDINDLKKLYLTH
ncbi:tyrosine-protein phosphatase [Secundilactobacillus silagei]|uniref:tyrosine-protein phosphatase n=1 Tax=Secundilactobacillus silagei TaxID=1293415 RepID=UPI002093D7E0|nr:tyrosine-protein phosphatase [Secundilactobacillus silagei]